MNREIILMRHGQPNLTMLGKVSLFEMQHWIEHYNLSEITRQPAPQASMQLAATARVIVSSSAPRALSSVRALCLQPTVVDPVFCEAQLPHGRWRLPKLSGFTWAFILRISWLCGFSGTVESARQAKLRAGKAARQLQDLSSAGPVLLLGHGLMNRMIGKQLEANGWTRQIRNGNRYWSTVVYQMNQQ
jgi:broad specificity phosphatase PhoE